jgi:hypothetical protein
MKAIGNKGPNDPRTGPYLRRCAQWSMFAFALFVRFCAYVTPGIPPGTQFQLLGFAAGSVGRSPVAGSVPGFSLSAFQRFSS